jgi:hypothetical protein
LLLLLLLLLLLRGRLSSEGPLSERLRAEARARAIFVAGFTWNNNFIFENVRNLGKGKF